MNLIDITTPEIPNYNLFRAKCEWYEPLADSEGICVPTQRIVSRVAPAGCDNSENCIELKRYLESIKK